MLESPNLSILLFKEAQTIGSEGATGNAKIVPGIVRKRGANDDQLFKYARHFKNNLHEDRRWDRTAEYKGILI